MADGTGDDALGSEHLHRLATLVVEALGVGTTKREWDVVDELFAEFGEVVPEPDASVGLSPAALVALREAAAVRLVAASGSPGDLLNAFMRYGGRFVAMLDDVYAFLAKHMATTAGSGESFRIRRDEVDESEIVVSPAFVEQVRRLERRLGAVRVGRLDYEAIGDFTRADNGEFYGTWKGEGPGHGLRIADAVLHLAWLRDSPRQGPDPVILADACAAAERLVRAAEGVVRGYLGTLDALPDESEDVILDRLRLDAALHDRWGAAVLRELQYYREHGVIGTAVFPAYLTAIDGSSLIGLDGGLRPVVNPLDDYWGGVVGGLAGFVAMARTGRWSPRRAEELRREWTTEHDLTVWLETVTTAADAAARWLTESASTPGAAVPAEVLVELVEDYLRLPLWRQRDLLYEVWVLAMTIDEAEAGGWTPQLNGVSDDVWRLSRGGSAQAVALLRHPADSTQLEVWREPRRAVPGGELTPDVTVATTGEFTRDLLVVEAKDRVGLVSGARPEERGGRRKRGSSASMLVFARRYAVALRPTVTWVVNHCDLDDDVDPRENLGDPWTRVHLASGLRPGNVPLAFGESVRVALAVPGSPAEGTAGAGPGAEDWPAPVLILLDVTASMLKRRVPWRELEQALASGWAGTCRAVLFRDHPGSPDVTVELGPYDRPAELERATALHRPHGGGGNVAALEDALRAARGIVDRKGPHTVLVITDAPPHEEWDCPNSLDHRAEIDALLSSGSRLLLATDWLDLSAPTWQAPEGAHGWVAAPLDALLDLVAAHVGSAGSPGVKALTAAPRPRSFSQSSGSRDL